MNTHMAIQGLPYHHTVVYFSLLLMFFYHAHATGEGLSTPYVAKLEFTASGEVGDERINILTTLKNGTTVVLGENQIVSQIPTTYLFYHNVQPGSEPVSVEIGFINDNIGFTDGKDRNVIIKDSQVLYNGINIWTTMIRYSNLDGSFKSYVQDPGRFLGFYTGGILFWGGYLKLPILYEAIKFRAKGVTGTEQLAITVNFHGVGEGHQKKLTVFNETLSSLGFRQYFVPVTLDTHVYSIEFHFVNGGEGAQTSNSPMIAIKDGVVTWKGKNVMQARSMFYPPDGKEPVSYNTPEHIIRTKYGNLREGLLFFRGFVKMFADYNTVNFSVRGSTGAEIMKVVLNEGASVSRVPGETLVESVELRYNEWMDFDLAITSDVVIYTIDVHFVNDGDVENVNKNVLLKNGQILLNNQVNLWTADQVRYYQSGGRWSSFVNNDVERFAMLVIAGKLAWEGFARVFVDYSTITFQARGTVGIEVIKVTINFQYEKEEFYVGQLIGQVLEEKGSNEEQDKKTENDHVNNENSKRYFGQLQRPNRKEGHYDYQHIRVPIPNNRPIRSVELHFVNAGDSDSMASPLQVEIYQSRIEWRDNEGKVDNLMNTNAWWYSPNGTQG